MSNGRHPEPERIQELHDEVDSYLSEHLLPFWMQNSPDPGYGGFLSYFDENGEPTGETTKTFLMQIRLLYSFSAAHRAGYGGERARELAEDAAEFILNHYWDHRQGGWYWIADRRGRPTNLEKVGYGQCFGIYAFCEYYLATGDEDGYQAALDTYSAVMQHMADSRHGGFIELMKNDWQPRGPGKQGGDRKSLDVHMHMMEALTSLYMASEHPTHARRLRQVIDLILDRMLEPETGTGYFQFAMDFTPLPGIEFDLTWGRDREPDQGERPLDLTSPGHNVELAWLLLRAADALGDEREDYAETVRKLCDHCVEYGIDDQYGGVYAETPMDRPTELTEKQFWQQAEGMIGMLDAYELFGDPKYWDAFVNVYDFLMDNLVLLDAGGEWLERVDRKGHPVDTDLAHAWKINYHSVRGMLEVERRLDRMSPGAE